MSTDIHIQSLTATSGIKRLAQRVVFELFTERDSVSYLPQHGCSFITRLYNCKSEFEVYVAFAAARSHIKRIFKSDEKYTQDKNELLATVKLDRVILADGKIVLLLTIVNKAKKAIQLETPALMLE